MEYSKKLSVMSYNILYKHDPTGVQYVNVINTILEAMPDIRRVQECTVQWRDILDGIKRLLHKRRIVQREKRNSRRGYCYLLS